MVDDSHPSTSSSNTTGGSEVTAVLAHSMLGTATAIRGALDMAMADGVDPSGRSSLMLMILNRLDFLVRQLQELAAGVPGDVVVGLRRERTGDPVIEAGTAVELFSAFNRTWTAGFVIAGTADVGYRVRRLTDGTLLPGYTSPSDLRVREAHDDELIP